MAHLIKFLMTIFDGTFFIEVYEYSFDKTFHWDFLKNFLLTLFDQVWNFRWQSLLLNLRISIFLMLISMFDETFWIIFGGKFWWIFLIAIFDHTLYSKFFMIVFVDSIWSKFSMSFTLEYFWWNILKTLFDETFYWQFQMKFFNDTFWCNWSAILDDNISDTFS